MRIENIINPDLALRIENHTLTIFETNNIDNNGLKEVIINDLPNAFFAFSTDKTIENRKVRNSFLHAESLYINKNCDAILIDYYGENEIDVVFIELKSGNPTPIEYEAQLINAKLLMDYMVTLFNTHPFTNNSQDISIRKRTYLLLSLSKKPDRAILFEKNIRSEMKHYQNEKIIKIPLTKTTHNFFSYNELIKGNIHYS